MKGLKTVTDEQIIETFKSIVGDTSEEKLTTFSSAVLVSLSCRIRSNKTEIVMTNCNYLGEPAGDWKVTVEKISAVEKTE